MHGTTVLCVRKDNKVVLIADGQVTIRRLHGRRNYAF